MPNRSKMANTKDEDGKYQGRCSFRVDSDFKDRLLVAIFVAIRGNFRLCLKVIQGQRARAGRRQAQPFPKEAGLQPLLVSSPPHFWNAPGLYMKSTWCAAGKAVRHATSK